MANVVLPSRQEKEATNCPFSSMRPKPTDNRLGTDLFSGLVKQCQLIAAKAACIEGRHHPGLKPSPFRLLTSQFQGHHQPQAKTPPLHPHAQRGDAGNSTGTVAHGESVMTPAQGMSARMTPNHQRMETRFSV